MPVCPNRNMDRLADTLVYTGAAAEGKPVVGEEYEVSLAALHSNGVFRVGYRKEDGDGSWSWMHYDKLSELLSDWRYQPGFDVSVVVH